ncbi:MAG: tetratricopeptide repeat protein, partial [Methylobacter sp.]|nr:tetratricopeptide repeat protein [Methylobacter sp.]
MEAIDTFRFDHQRYTSASSLHPQHNADFMRLVKDIRYGSRFQFLIAEYNDVLYRDFLIDRLDTVLTGEGLKPVRLDISRKTYSDFAALEAKMRKLAADYHAIHIIDTDNWFDAAQWEAFNIRREAVAQNVPLRLILWLDSKPISQLALIAPDLWAWRGGVFSFATTTHYSVPEPRQANSAFDTRSLPQRSKRIAELRSYLKSEPPPPDDIRLNLLDELAELLRSLGELDESLRIRQEEALPAYSKLGDLRSVAVTQGKIADILYARGQLDEALRISQEEELPVYSKLGDLRELAVCQGRIADILYDRGQLDEALRIRQEEALPAY